MPDEIHKNWCSPHHPTVIPKSSARRESLTVRGEFNGYSTTSRVLLKSQLVRATHRSTYLRNERLTFYLTNQLDSSKRDTQYFKCRMPEQIEEHRTTRRATFGMGCFWAGDSLFGATPGVIRTCVGYAGGDKPSPTYRSIGDHTEVVDIEYDPGMVSFTQLLSLFWNNHEYGLTTKIKRQYASLILYHDEEQRGLAEKSRAHEQRERGEQLVTEIKEFEKFYPAEDYHQKYRLQGHSWLVESIGLTTSEALRTSSLACKLNGYIAGAGTVEQFDKELSSFNLNEKESQYLRKCVVENQGSGLYC